MAFNPPASNGLSDHSVVLMNNPLNLQCYWSYCPIKNTLSIFRIKQRLTLCSLSEESKSGWYKTLGVWSRSPSSAHTEAWCMLLHLTVFAQAAILSTRHGSSGCGSLLRVQMLRGGPALTSEQTWDQRTVDLQSSSSGPFRWGVHNGEVSLTEGWINVAWRREFPPHFLPWLPHHIQLLNSLLCVINLFLPP